MEPDDLKQAWQAQASQTRLTIDAELLAREVRRNHKSFGTMIFMRDVREVGISLLMVPLWIYMGVKLSLPWTSYLTIPALLWVAGYMLVDRKRHARPPIGPGEPLRQHVEHSLAELNHQIRLLRTVFWWYLLPLALPILAFFGQVAWRARGRGGWESLASFLFLVAVVTFVFAVVYWANQYAVRSGLEPRRRELETLLMGLQDETPDASGP